VPSAKGDKPNAEPDLQVGRWCVQPSLNELRDGPTVRHVEPQVMDLLVFLASRDGRVVSKDEIIDGVWEGRFIAEATLTRSIADLRRALGDSRARPQYIETIAKRGYRIVAAVSRGDGGGAPGEDADTGGEGASAPVPEPCLIVLPFADLGPDSSPYFCDGLTDDIINALTRVSGLRVISRTSAFAVHARGADVAEIGRGLGATHAIEGSVRQAEGRLRVTAQLVDLRTHCHVWSERYDRALSDVFAIQDEIAAGIARRLQLTLDGLAARAAAPTTSMEAYARLLEGATTSCAARGRAWTARGSASPTRSRSIRVSPPLTTRSPRCTGRSASTAWPRPGRPSSSPSGKACAPWRSTTDPARRTRSWPCCARKWITTGPKWTGRWPARWSSSRARPWSASGTRSAA
jgi:TolB-like protein